MLSLPRCQALAQVGRELAAHILIFDDGAEILSDLIHHHDKRQWTAYCAVLEDLEDVAKALADGVRVIRRVDL